MKIKKISYTDQDWELDNLQLSNVNLVVGKNSTGKTRTLQTIDLLVKMITQKRDLSWGCQWNILFENHKKDEINYQFSTSYSRQEPGVTFEKMILNGDIILSRKRKHDGGQVKIKNHISNDYEFIYPPDNKLVIHTNRDVKKYPYIEDIANWAEHSYGFKFGNISPYSPLNQQKYDLLTAVEDIPTLLKSLSSIDKEKIKADFNSLGYNISDISLQDWGGVTVMYVTEEGLTNPIPHFKLSQGMLRSLALIVYLQYLVSRKKPATIIIDDLCEGLDYERATKLGKLLFENSLNNDIQR